MPSSMDINSARSYVDEFRLVDAIKRNGLQDYKYLVVGNKAGRFTAIFPLGWNPSMNIAFTARAGFMVVG